MTEDPRKGLPSASRMDMLANCPGSGQAQSAYSQEDDTQPSKEGTRIHNALENGLFDELTDDEHEIAMRLETMLERERSDWQYKYGIQDTDPVDVAKERRYFIESPDGSPICSAQVDRVEIRGDKALVVDYKTGYLDVTPGSRNMQIRTQAVAVWRNHPEVVAIRGVVASYRFKEQATRVDYTKHHLAMAYREIQLVCWRAQQPGAPRVPGEHCRYCKAKADCPQCAAVMALMPAAAVGPVPADQIASRVAGLTIQQLVQINSAKPIAEALFTAVSNRIRNLDPEELAAIGCKLVASQRSRVKDLKLFAKLAIENDLIPKERFIEVCDIVLKRLVDIAVPRLLEQGVPTAKAAKERIQVVLEPAMEKYDIAPRIIKTSEPKELKQ